MDAYHVDRTNFLSLRPCLYGLRGRERGRVRQGIGSIGNKRARGGLVVSEERKTKNQAILYEYNLASYKKVSSCHYSRQEQSVTQCRQCAPVEQMSILIKGLLHDGTIIITLDGLARIPHLFKRICVTSRCTNSLRRTTRHVYAWSRSIGITTTTNTQGGWVRGRQARRR